MPTSKRWPKPAGSREIGNATGVAAGVTVAVGGWGVAAGVRRPVGDGVLSDSTARREGVPRSPKSEASTVSVASLPAGSLVEVVSPDGVGERVAVAILVAAGVEAGVLVGLGRPVAVGKGG